MKREQLIPAGAGECHGPYAIGVKMGNQIFTTQIGTTASGDYAGPDIKSQTKATMENAKAVLEAGGATFDDVAKVTINISDINLIPEMNEIYKSYFEEGNYPARCCTQCVSMVDGCLVEMEFTAII